MIQKVINFYSRIYSAAFPPSYAARVKNPPSFLDALKWGALFAATFLFSCLLGVSIAVIGSSLLGPGFAIVMLFFVVITGMTVLLSRAI